ncbi:MAG: QueT transporter family protein [Oscillospiraceae bacterium]|jgi:uncharacterized membrane protein|nr:QueT transporter family protein [Oscillospiraceae bacterium]
MKITTKQITFAGILAAAYASLTYLSGLFGLAYGPVQFRISEALAVLCCFTPWAIPGMVIGCVAANLLSTVSAWDMVIGTAATLIACVLTWRMGRAMQKKPWIAWLAPLPTILCNALIVGAEIAIFFDDRAFLPAWGMNALSVGAGEAAVLYVLGMPLLLWLRSNRRMRSELERL